MKKFKLSEKMLLKDCDGLGVYEINLGGFIYVGSSSMVTKRIFNHRSLLRSGRHINVLLQEAYNSYSEDSIEISVLFSIDAKDEEVYRTTKYKNMNISLNLNIGHKQDSIVKSRISETLKGLDLKRRKFNWYTNGINSIQLFKGDDAPLGYYEGRTITKI